MAYERTLPPHCLQTAVRGTDMPYPKQIRGEKSPLCFRKVYYENKDSASHCISFLILCM